MIRRPPRSTHCISSAASDVYKRQSPDPELTGLGNVAAEDAERLWQYLRQGGVDNARQFFHCIANRYLDRNYTWEAPRALPRVGLYHPHKGDAHLDDWRADWQPNAPVAALLFYRTHVQAANTAFVDTFCQRLQAQGLNPVSYTHLTLPTICSV